MTGATAPDVTVSVIRSPDFTQLEFRARRDGVPPFRATLGGRDVLEKARRELDSHLLLLKDDLPTLKTPDDDLYEVFTTLHRIGLQMIWKIFGSRRSVLSGLQDFWKCAVPFGRNPAVSPVVECVGELDALLPLELLPLFDIQPPEDIEGPEAFVRACRTLIGFSCVVKRTILPVGPCGGIWLHSGPEGRMPLRYLYVEHLDGARQELKWFIENAAGRVEIEGPYPAGQDGGLTLARQIYDPTHMLDGRHRDLPDQIQHFACHCYTDPDSPSESEIELSGGGHELRVTLGTLGEDLVTLAAGRSRQPIELPLVVMNACGSARMHATSAPSFPYLFLQNGNRGFVGSEIEIPDDVAATFSRALYERFLLWRKPLGEAILSARNQLLHELRNPLGIIYSAYCDPELRVHSCTKEACAGATARI
jgi:hypothetical protein